MFNPSPWILPTCPQSSLFDGIWTPQGCRKFLFFFVWRSRTLHWKTCHGWSRDAVRLSREGSGHPCVLPLWWDSMWRGWSCDPSSWGFERAWLVRVRVRSAALDKVICWGLWIRAGGSEGAWEAGQGEPHTGIVELVGCGKMQRDCGGQPGVAQSGHTLNIMWGKIWRDCFSGQEVQVHWNSRFLWSFTSLRGCWPSQTLEVIWRKWWRSHFA